MKLTFLLTVIFLNVCAAGISQNINYSGRDQALKDVFSAIEKQAGIVFLYYEDQLHTAKPVTIDAKKMPLHDFLDSIFKNQPLNYSFDSKTVTVYPKSNKDKYSEFVKEFTIPDTTGDIEYSGKVMNEAGVPLESATVEIKSLNRIIRTNVLGDFKIKGNKQNNLISVSFSGFQKTEIRGTAKSIMVYLSPEVKELDKVVIQGYGTTSKRLATGNITTIAAEEIERQPVINVLEAIKGKVPGLTVVPTSSYASGTFKMELRGRAQINSDFPSDPLIIIDGVPLTILEQGTGDYSNGSTGLNQNKFPTPAGGQSPLFSVDPDDIESVSVLKDADATAIYGSRGGRGVILITTKKGRVGQTKIDLDVSTGISMITKYPKMLSTKEYIMMRKEAFANNGIEYTDIDAYDFRMWDSTMYTDWAKKFWGKNASRTDAELSISGGDKQTTFRISTTYATWKGLNSYAGSDSRSTLSVNLNHKTLNNKFDFGLSIMYSNTKVNNILMNGPVTLPPTAPNIFNDEGQLNYDGYEPYRFLFPFGNLLRPYEGKTDFVNGSSRITFHAAKGLKLFSTLGYSASYLTQYATEPIAASDPVNHEPGRANFGFNKAVRAIIEPQIEYEKIVGPGKLLCLFGGTYQAVQQQGSRVIGDGYVNDNLLRSINNAKIKTPSDNGSEFKYTAVFGRVNYNIQDKYIFTLNGRRDGSSKFGNGNRFGNFGSVAGAWIFSNEGFIANSFRFLTFGKIRSSYGIVGSDLIGDYGYLARWVAINPYGNSVGYIPNNLANLNLQWQVDRKFEVAIQLVFLEDRLSFDLAWYRNVIGNQLYPKYTLPLITGFSSVASNFPGKVLNVGWEPSLTYKVIKTKNVDLQVNLQLGINRNKLLAFPGLAESPYANEFEVGKSLSIKKVLKYTGVDPQTGKYTYQDINKSGAVGQDAADDDRVWKDITPKYDGGFGTDLRFRRWVVNLLFHVKKQVGSNARTYTTPGMANNQLKEVLNRWQKPGDISDYPRFTTFVEESDSYYGFSDAAYVNASFVRMTNISISYSLPRALTAKINSKEIKLTIRGQNLFYISPYKGADPEIQGFGSMPIPAGIVAGLVITF